MQNTEPRSDIRILEPFCLVWQLFVVQYESCCSISAPAASLQYALLTLPDIWTPTGATAFAGDVEQSDAALEHNGSFGVPSQLQQDILLLDTQRVRVAFYPPHERSNGPRPPPPRGNGAELRRSFRLLPPEVIDVFRPWTRVMSRGLSILYHVRLHDWSLAVA